MTTMKFIRGIYIIIGLVAFGVMPAAFFLGWITMLLFDHYGTAGIMAGMAFDCLVGIPTIMIGIVSAIYALCERDIL